MNKFVAGAVIVVVFATAQHARAADDIMVTKAPTTPYSAASAYDWTGFYVGSHLGYAGGSSHWSATQDGAAAPSLAGTLDFFNMYNAFRGTGSDLLGLQAGYNYMFRSRFLLGAEADVSFPAVLGGSQTISSALIGQASYQEQVQMSGTVRARIGYAPGNWLFYATGGFAWSYDQFTRTQLAGMPVGGTAQPGEVETLLMVPRVGGAVGAGIELALTPSWAARLEYLYTDYGLRGVTFAGRSPAFQFRSRCPGLRLGLDYRLGSDSINPDLFTKGPAALDIGLVRRARADHFHRAICRAVPRAL